MSEQSYYDILGVARDADEKTLKSAFRKKAMEHHPDRNPGDKEAEAKFKDINQAYEILKDPQKRAAYDRYGHAAFQNGGAPGGGDGFGSSMADIFEDLFGSMMGGGGRQRSGGRERGSDLRYNLEITLEEAFQGTTRTLESSDGSRIQANIPRGVQTGSKVRMRGAVGQNDVLLKVEVKHHETFTRNGDDLRVQVPVDLYTALLGGEITVPTLERSVALTVPASTQNGRTFRLRGLGMPKLKQPDQRGDLLAEVAIKLLTDLTAEEKELFQKLKALRSTRS